MKLFLASEAKNPVTIEHLQSYTGGLKDKSIVYIPTASNGEVGHHWSDGQSYKIARSLCADFRIVELEKIGQNPIAAVIGKPDIIWVAGGKVTYLLEWMHRTGFSSLLPQLLNEGVLYVGSSAGSMACSKTQTLLEWYIGESEPGAGKESGLGLIDFEIYPHYHDELLEDIKRVMLPATVYLLKDGEVITVFDSEIKILGEKRILSK